MKLTVTEIVTEDLLNEAGILSMSGMVDPYQAKRLHRIAYEIKSGDRYAMSFIKGLADVGDLEVKRHRECRTKRGSIFTRMICDDGKGGEIQVNYFPTGRRSVSVWDGRR